MLGLTVVPYCFSSDGLESTRKLAEQGDSSAQFSLGWFYYYGYVVPKDYKEAVKWYRKSAEQGNVEAQRWLGACYCYGKGVPKDYVFAYMWFNLSLAEDDQISKQEIDTLEEEMTPEQIEEAQKLSREWFNKKNATD